MLYYIILGIQLISALSLIIIVLLQTGKGSEVGFAFGAGAAQTMFGSGGGKSFIMKFTVTVAILFMVTCTMLAFMQAKKGGYTGVLNTKEPAAEAPAVPAGAQPVSAQPAQSQPSK